MNLAASIQERVKGLLPDLMGIEFTDVTPDKVVAKLEVRKDLCTIRSETGKLVALVTQTQLVIAPKEV